jgi:hypothetical protein
MESIERELRVIRTNNGSPVLQRIIKWAIFLGVARKLRGTRWFRAWAFGLPIAGIVVHMFYRHKTDAWTKPRGGFKDRPGLEDGLAFNGELRRTTLPRT